MAEQEDAFIANSNIDTPESILLNRQDSFNDALEAIQNGKSVILFGPPGTGKTKMVYELLAKLKETDSLGKFESIQFHHKFTYEDFIEGYAPNESGGFYRKDGIFKTFIKSPSEDNKVDLFLIDEINRADLTTTFGELLFLMDDRHERSVKTSHFDEEIRLPVNTVIIGTMNTADRSIATIDFALRRRFTFVSLYTDYESIASSYSARGVEGFEIDNLVNAAKKINHRIAQNRLMGRHMELGNSMWIPVGSGTIAPRDLLDLFRQSIIPQVEAYCGYGYEDQMSKIFNQNIAQLYLNRNVITTDDILGLIEDLANKKQ